MSDTRPILIHTPGGTDVRLVRMVAFEPPPLGGITRRQREILAVTCQCGSDQEAADRLGIRVMTVKNNLTAIRRDLGVRRMSQLCYALGSETERELMP